MAKRIEEPDLTKLMDGVSEDIAETVGAQAAILRINTESGDLHYCGIGSVELTGVTREPIHPVSMAESQPVQLR